MKKVAKIKDISNKADVDFAKTEKKRKGKEEEKRNRKILERVKPVQLVTQNNTRR